MIYIIFNYRLLIFSHPRILRSLGVKKQPTFITCIVHNSSQTLLKCLWFPEANEPPPEFTNNDSLSIYLFNLSIRLSKCHSIYFLSNISLFFRMSVVLKAWYRLKIRIYVVIEFLKRLIADCILQLQKQSRFPYK